jgi:2-hydroxychromene-2-carboxylate isomerase
VEDPLALAAILREVGADTTTFWRYSAYEAAEAKLRGSRPALPRRNTIQVFGVPSFVIDLELFLGCDRINWLERKLQQMGLRRTN